MKNLGRRVQGEKLNIWRIVRQLSRLPETKHPEEVVTTISYVKDTERKEQ